MNGHIAIPAVDLKRSQAFYETLDFIVTKEWERPEWGLTGCFMEHRSGTIIELIYHQRNQNIRFPEVAEVLHVAVPVRDLEELMKNFSEAGVTVVRPITPGITVKRLAFIKDPSGFTVELFEPK